MPLRFRTISEVLVAWLLGATLGLLALLWPVAEPCPHHQACPIKPTPLWQVAVIVAAFLGPGLFATVSWLRSLRSRPDDRS